MSIESMGGAQFRVVAAAFVEAALGGRAVSRSRVVYAPATVDVYARTLRLHVLESFDAWRRLVVGDVLVNAVDARLLQRLVDRLVVVRGAALARHGYAATAAVLRFGYLEGVVEALPGRVLLPAPARGRDRWLSFAEAERLIAAARVDDARFRRSLAVPLVALLLGSGCRIGEALSVVWGADGLDLDAEPARLRVGARIAKTPAGIRAIALDPNTATTMARHRVLVGGEEGTPVFRDAAGRPLSHRGLVSGVFGRIAAAARVGRVTPQVLRHTHASWAASAGARVPALAARLGHADPGFTLRRYAHPERADVDAIALLVAAARRRAG